MNAAYEFHAGERAVQLRAKEAAIAVRNATVVSDTVIAGARGFIAKQFMVVLSSVDAAGRVWSSLLFGAPGFLQSADGHTVSVRAPAEERDDADPFWRNIAANSRVGMLFIELASRRRYRVNGWVQSNTEDGIEVGIAEAYPNCPQYIQRRHLRGMGAAPGGALSVTEGGDWGAELPAALRAIIGAADTIFVASSHAERGADASHRGGNPGFVQVLEDGTLRIPDYHGNSMFNTLGNIEADPRVGIMVPDFPGNRLLQLSGKADIQWDQPDPDGRSGGTGRFWEFRVEQWVLREVPQRVEWEYLDASPFNPVLPRTGASS
jgi:predicted pyridoxine 5'-phosphate oxidase superfamily flavin-nucleotide-binding protein